MQMTYPEDVLKAAREAAAEVADRLGKHGYRARYERGQFDNSIEVRAACIAIMAERQRCAGELRKQIAGLHAQTEALDISRDVSALKIALSAILGQQEAAHDGA